MISRVCGSRTCPRCSLCEGALFGHGSTSARTMASALGPEIRTTPTPPPVAVAMAAMVSRGFLGVTSRKNDEVAIDALALGARGDPRHVGQRDVHDPTICRAHRIGL